MLDYSLKRDTFYFRWHHFNHKLLNRDFPKKNILKTLHSIGHNNILNKFILRRSICISLKFWTEQIMECFKEWKSSYAPTCWIFSYTPLCFLQPSATCLRWTSHKYLKLPNYPPSKAFSKFLFSTMPISTEYRKGDGTYHRRSFIHLPKPGSNYSWRLPQSPQWQNGCLNKSDLYQYFLNTPFSSFTPFL